MQRGQKVKVYEDPITCERLEGQAVTDRRLPHAMERKEPGCEEWWVTFAGELEKCRRLINLINH